MRLYLNEVDLCRPTLNKILCKAKELQPSVDFCLKDKLRPEKLENCGNFCIMNEYFWFAVSE